MSHGTCPTVRIKVAPCQGNPAGELDINASDFQEGMITVEAYEASVKAAAESAIKAHVAETQVDPRAEQTSPAPDTVEEPKPQTRVVEAEGKVDAGKKGKTK
jgi:hypothetical protein